MRLLIIVLASLWLARSSMAAEHIDVMPTMIALKKQSAPKAEILMIGDSNTEAIWWDRACGDDPAGWIINGGIGGITVKGYLCSLRLILSSTSPKVVTIMLGTNDANSKRIGIKDDREWEANYTKFVDTAIATNAKVILFTVPPVEQGKSLGEGYFSTAQIRRFNTHIRTLARVRGIELIDVYAMWSGPDGYAPRDTTIDGVHFSYSRQLDYFAQIKNAVLSARASLGQPCE